MESAALAGIRDQAVDTVTIAVEATEGMELPETDEPTYSGNDGGDDVTVPNVSFAQGMGTAGTAQTPQVTSLSTGVLSDPAKQDFVHAMQVEGIAPTVVPQVGDVCADPGLVNALEIMDGLSVSFRSRVALIHAESVESTSLVLDNGIEVAFGSSKDVKDKERVVTKLLKEHEGAIAYINVRVVSDPTWRGIDG
ncbi:MAG: cell division protein FtsQ/DivIB [Coriobacteriales bacterium]|nr:cell division protein FtsQ/DivIB [Coriobacteriales bacterium]